MKYSRLITISILALTMLLLVGGVAAQDKVSIRYALWDTNQLPPYQECANDFMAENPNIEIVIEQLGWADYWTAITTGFVSGEAPDVFTNHLAKYPEFVLLGQIYDIQPWVERDGVATDIYYPGLAELWTKDGGRYGLPKDWDTVAVVYNVDMIEAAGIDPAIFDTWTWNYDDGGEFEQVIAQLTLDTNGNNGLSPDFDKNNVAVYGFGNNGSGGPYGQTEWSMFTASTGWQHNNGLWGDEYYYDDERFIKTQQWLADLALVKGYVPPFADQSGLGRFALFQSGRTAMGIDGSWMIGSYLSSDFEVGFARLPAGPEGRKSMFNGLADSIYIGTEHPEEAWSWVKYLGSEACQSVVGASGVVFPAIPSATELSLQVRADAGVDVSAFTDQAAEEGGTFLFPITDFGGDINTIMNEAMDAVYLGQGSAADLIPPANEEINSLFE